jgi:cytochrome c biogenesis protein CcmG/thiol:disulfide interchange protein DsbE
MTKRYWTFFPLMLFLLVVIFFWRGLSLDPHHLPSTRLGKPLPSFRMPLLYDSQKVLTPTSFKGKTVLLNVWASWCEACVEEQLFMLQLAREGILIYGLNYKDDNESARNWLEEWGNPYQRVAEDRQGKVAIDLGVYGAPETFLIDSAGIIRYRHVGALNASIWKADFVPRMKQLERTV